MRRTVAALLAIAVLLSLTWQATGAAKGVETYKVYADSLNVRSEPSDKAKIEGSLKYGELVEGLAERHGWLQIRSERVSGWVAGYYLKKVDAASGAKLVPVHAVKETGGKQVKPAKTALTGGAPSAGGSAASVVADGLRLRKGPGLEYGITGSLARGSTLTVIGRDGEWARVRTPDGSIGWVSAVYLGPAGGSGSDGRASAASAGSLRGRVIVIDPGHGGNDPGMLGTTYDSVEKELTLSTSRLLEDELRARGAKVILTRTEDEKPSLSKRVEISETNGADAFVSIHYNSSETKTSGTLTFYYSRKKDEPLARAIEARLKSGTGLKSNGVAYGNYHVLRENDSPSALVELGFLSNPKDEKLAQSEEYRSKAAAAIAAGLEDYFD